MGKKGGWFAAIKRVFVAQSKEKPVNEGTANNQEEKKKKKKGFGKLRHGERTSFIPLFKEPSSIEKILGEAEKEHNLIFRPPTPLEQSTTPSIVPSQVVTPRVPSPRAASPRAASSRPASSSPPSPRVASPRVPSQRIASPRAPSPGVDSPQTAQRIASPRAPPARVDSPQAASQRIASPRAPPARVASPQVTSQRIASPRNITQKEIHQSESTLRDYHASAVKIQASFRGYMARRSVRALRGLVRLQGVMQGSHVKRQTTNAVKQMQLLVRVQSQIRSRRIQMLENQARQYKNEKDVESTMGKLSLASEAGNSGDWENSALTKEEVEARLHRKVEAVIKRERAMSYAYSHQSWKTSSKSSKGAVFDVRSGGFPVWWNWLERQLHPENHAEDQPLKTYRLTPGRANSELKSSSRPPSRNYKQSYSGYENMDSFTPRSSRSSVVMSLKQPRTPSSGRMLQGSSSSVNKYSRSRASGAGSPFNVPLKDDESLISCPPFSVPNYMVPTVSAKAKVRASSNPRERFPGTPSNDSKRRFSFPLTQGVGSFKINNGKESSSEMVLDNQHQSLDVSIDSTMSLPPGAVGRKPFNRFV